MKILYVVLGFLYCVPVKLLSQVVGAQQAALASCSVAEKDVFSIINNPASSAFTENVKLALFYNNKYLQAEVNEYALASAFPTKKLGTWGLGFCFFGYSEFQESTISLSYAKNFGSKFSLGFKGNYHRIAIEENGSKHLFSFDVGMYFQPIEKLSMGIVVQNPARQKIEKVFKETLATQIKVGANYHVSPKFDILFEAQKEISKPILFRTGFAYQVHKIFSLNMGAASQPALVSGGFGLLFKNFQLDFASTWNSHLGFSPQFSMSHSFQRKAHE